MLLEYVLRKNRAKRISKIVACTEVVDYQKIRNNKIQHKKLNTRNFCFTECVIKCN